MCSRRGRSGTSSSPGRARWGGVPAVTGVQVQQGFDHPGLLQLQQQFHHQQQMQHQLMLGAGHANLAPLVGQQISQLSSLVGGHASQQSPPGLGQPGLNVMALQQQHGGQVGREASSVWMV